MEKPFGVSVKAVWGSRAVLASVTVLALLASAGCKKATEGQAPVYLVIDNLGAAAGVEPDAFGDYLMSDVLTYVKVNNVMVPTIFQDNGRVSLHVALKDFGRPTSPNAPSAYNQVVIERYHVTFIRADGKNTPGVDVPYGFDGAITGTVGASSSELGFPLVRAAAKTEAPLAALIGAGGAQHISCIAQITFYGHDEAGNAISVSGQMTVDFADWGDPTS